MFIALLSSQEVTETIVPDASYNCLYFPVRAGQNLGHFKKNL